jgi:cysteine synthase A
MVYLQETPVNTPSIQAVDVIQEDRAWVDRAIGLIEADQRRSADTHLLRFDAHALAGIDIYLKDESTHPTGSLKHRLARSLFLYGLCGGTIREGRAVVEASSGSTAVSEAHFARLIGVPFYAVLPRQTSQDKISAIEHQGGHCHYVDDSTEIYAEAVNLARRLGGHYLDQFTFAERATDWRGNNNIAESIFDQMKLEPRHPPAWIVMSTGTGGTTSTIGRYIRYKHLRTRLLVADVEHSAFFEAYRDGNREVVCTQGSRIEGIGRPRVEPSFLPTVIDAMIKVPDAMSIASMRVLSNRLGRRVGASTGTNFVGVCWAAARLLKTGEQGSLVTLICDSGERYLNTYHSPEWVAARGMDSRAFESTIERFLDGGPLRLVIETAS